MKITIVIPNYNGEELLKKNMNSVYESARFHLSRNNKDAIEIIYVDDCSTDNSISVIRDFIQKNKKEKMQFEMISNSKNTGFSSTVNTGAECAIGEVIILLNTDVSPEKDFIEPLVEVFKDPNVFAVGCLEKSIEKSKVLSRGRGIGKWQRGFLVHARGEVDKSNTLWVSGGSGAFSKKIWNKLGGFETLFNPFYYEDIDLSYRALKAGYDLFFQTKSIVTHEHERGAIVSKFSSSQIQTIAYRNQIMFAWLNATDTNLVISHIFWLPYHLCRALIGGDWAFVRGFVNALILSPVVIKSYGKRQSFLKKSDAEVINNFLE